MKKKVEFIGIIVLAMIMGLSMMSCGEEDTCLEGHEWGEWEEATAPTTTVDGTEIRVCEVCGEEDIRDLPSYTLFYGSWTEDTSSATKQKITITATGLVIDTNPAAESKFTFRIDTWGGRVNNAKTGTDAPTAANFPNGYSITGATTSNTTSTISPDRTELELYFGASNGKGKLALYYKNPNPAYGTRSFLKD